MANVLVVPVYVEVPNRSASCLHAKYTLRRCRIHLLYWRTASYNIGRGKKRSPAPESFETKSG